MSMLEYNEIKEHKIIVWDGQPHEVLASHVFRKQQRKPVNATKLKNLLTGRVAEISFGSSEKAEEADITTRPVKFLYKNKNEIWFCDVNDPSNRFTLKEEIVGDKMRFVKANSEIETIIYTNDDDEEQVIGVKIPIKLELEVVDAPPAIKGASVTGGNKVATLETGATINVPLFINIGEKIRINSETGEYVERVN
jgi:elongation factor P